MSFGSDGTTTPAEELNDRNCEDLMRAAAGVSYFEPKKTGTTMRHDERGDCSTNGDGS